MSSSRRALLLAGALGLTLLVALVTISATAQSGSRAIALEEEIPVEDEVGPLRGGLLRACTPSGFSLAGT